MNGNMLEYVPFSNLIIDKNVKTTALYRYYQYKVRFLKEIFRQVYSYLTENSLAKFQSRFRPKHSRMSALIQMCERLNNMNNGTLNASCFFTFVKLSIP